MWDPGGALKNSLHQNRLFIEMCVRKSTPTSQAIKACLGDPAQVGSRHRQVHNGLSWSSHQSLRGAADAAQRVAGQFYPLRVMNRSVQDGVGVGGLTDCECQADTGRWLAAIVELRP